MANLRRRHPGERQHELASADRSNRDHIGVPASIPEDDFRPVGPYAVPDLPEDMQEGLDDAQAARSGFTTELRRPVTSDGQARFEDAHRRWESRQDVTLVHSGDCCGSGTAEPEVSEISPEPGFGGYDGWGLGFGGGQGELPDPSEAW